MQEEIRIKLKDYLKKGNHTPEEIKAEIKRLLHGEIFPGEIETIYNEITSEYSK